VAVGPTNREHVDALTAQAWTALHDLVRDEPDLPPPGPVGRWISEIFNEWPEGSRAAAEAAGGPDSAGPEQASDPVDESLGPAVPERS
jgi:hypothetical protein